VFEIGETDQNGPEERIRYWKCPGVGFRVGADVFLEEFCLRSRVAAGARFQGSGGRN